VAQVARQEPRYPRRVARPSRAAVSRTAQAATLRQRRRRLACTDFIAAQVAALAAAAQAAAQRNRAQRAEQSD
jgi:hypothetical protein